MGGKCANPDFLHSGGGGRGSTQTSTRSRKGRGGTADSNVRNKLDFQPNGSNWKKRKREKWRENFKRRDSRAEGKSGTSNGPERVWLNIERAGFSTKRLRE